jgi:hypothetical protein
VISAALLLGASGGGGGGTLESLGDLIVLFDSEQGRTLVEGEPTRVHTWTPVYGNANCPIVMDGANGQLIVADALNGYDVLDFTSAGGYSASSATAPGSEWTQFAVLKQNSFNGPLFGFRNGANFAQWNSKMALLFDFVVYHETSTASDTSWHIWIAERVGGVVTLYQDGPALSPTYSGSMPAQNDRWCLGDNGNGVAGGRGSIAIGGCYDGALGATNRNALGDLLATKYGLTWTP